MEEAVEVAKTKQHLKEAHAKFLSKSSWSIEQHGKVALPQELLPIMYEIVSLEKHLSQCLGYDSYLDYSLLYHDAMAKNSHEIEAVYDVFEQLGAVEKFGSNEYQSYYLDLVSNVSRINIREYFELNHMLNGLFGLCREMFDVDIQEEKEKCVNGWHRDVRLFHVFHLGEHHDGDVPIASFYMDPYRRPHKTMGCFMTPLFYKNGDSIPIAAISFDVRPPVWDDAPVELELQQVVNICHEFGHLFQHLLADVKLGAFSGAQNIEVDASETISQFMEYWLFDGDGLSKLSKHRDTGNCISQEIMNILQEQRRATKANELLHRLFLGRLELELSSSFDPHGEESMIALQRKCAERFIPCCVPPRGNIDPIIGIFQNNAQGKHYMQYRYLWSDIMSADAFDAFLDEDGKLKKGDDMKEVCDHLNKNWIAVGSSVPTSEAFASFRSRSARMDSLLSKYDLLMSHG
jgi:oligopeptidase A